MKKAVVFLLFFSAIFISRSARGQAMTEQEIKTMLCHTWKYTGLQMGKTKLPLPSPERLGGLYLEFKADGTTLRTGSDEDIQGKWSYDHKTLTIKIEDKMGKNKYKIASLTDSQFIYREKIAGVYDEMILERVQ